MMIIINIIVSIVENWSVLWTVTELIELRWECLMDYPFLEIKLWVFLLFLFFFGVSILFLTYDVLEMLLFLLVCLQKSVCRFVFWWVGEVFKIYLGFWVIVSNFLIIFLLISRFCMFNSSFWGKFVHICAKLKTILSFFIIVENNVSLAP